MDYKKNYETWLNSQVLTEDEKQDLFSISNDEKTVAGSITAEKLILKDEVGNTYSITLDTSIKIHNPY